MNTMIDIIFPLFFVLLMVLLLGAFGAVGMAAWSCLPELGQARLSAMIRRAGGPKASSRSGPPIYAVQADGHLLYASGKEDVQAFLGTTMHVASRQILHLVDEGHPATILLTCGKETILLEVHMPT